MHAEDFTYKNFVYLDLNIISSKPPPLPPEVTSRSRDVNKDGGGVNDLPPPHP